MSTKVLLDTDIGSDIDDALCLAYLLAQPECELLGVTTVTGKANRRAMMVSALCKIAGKNISIFPGVEHPLLAPTHQQHAPQASALDKWDHDTTFPHGQAIEFLSHTIRAHPGEIVLLCIGPLTNIGLLFAGDPEIPTLLKGLVLMCGQFVPPAREWNALADPHATAIVYRAPIRSHRSVGLDVTMKVSMNVTQFREQCRAPLLRPILDFAEIWSKHTDTVVFHDPLAATIIFDNSICTFTPGTVDVEFTNEQEGGLPRWHVWHPGDADPRHEVALEVKPQHFFTHYFGVF